MSETYLNNLSQIPECIPGPDRSGQLRAWLRHLNQQADEATHRSDDSFSRDNFNYAKTQAWGRALSKFGNFETFQNRIYEFISENLMSERCSCDGTYIDGGEKNVGCIPDPEASKLRTPPKKKIPPPPKTPPKPSKAEGYDISQLDLHQAPWWSTETPKETPPPYQARGSIPALSGKDFAPQGPSPLSGYIEEGPEKVRTNRPYLKANFDGKFFILDVYGCHVDKVTGGACIADWSYYSALLKNPSSNRNSRKKAGADGWVRVKVQAKVGDIIYFTGRDSLTLIPSINELRYTITQDGNIRLIGDFIRSGHKPNTLQKMGLGIKSLFPQLGNLLFESGQISKGPTY